MTAIEELIQELKFKKDSALELSKNFSDKSKRGKFKDYASAYVDAIITAEDIKKKHQPKNTTP